MVKAEELRLGNLLMTIKNDHIVTVGIDEIIYLFEDKRTHKLTGIPITEEWLEKLGFIFVQLSSDKSYKKFVDKAGVRINYNNSKNHFYLVLKKETIFVKYIHQLQNLYYSVHGKELKEEDNFIEI